MPSCMQVAAYFLTRAGGDAAPEDVARATNMLVETLLQQV